MSLYILDTDIFSLFLRGDENVCRRVVETSPDSLAITIITIEESLTGWYSEIRRARRDNEVLRAYASLYQTHEILRDLPVLAFDANALKIFHELRKSHRRVGRNDLRIAAITVNRSGTLVTRNKSDFLGIPRLTVVDWAQSLETNS
jgi:tRNA(fMet)-specific endonuclease VapC